MNIGPFSFGLKQPENKVSLDNKEHLENITTTARSLLISFITDEVLTYRKEINVNHRKKMLKDDAVDMVKKIKNASISSMGWHVNTEDENVKKFVEYNLTNLKEVNTGIIMSSIDDIIEDMSSAEDFGWAIGEILYGYDKEIWPDKKIIQSIKLRPIDDIIPKADDHGNLINISQSGTKGPIVVEAGKMYGKYFMYIFPSLKYGNYTGQSELDAIYRETRTKDIINKFWAIALERLADPIKIGHYLNETKNNIKAATDQLIKDEIKNINIPTEIDRTKGELKKKFMLDTVELSLNNASAYKEAVDTLDTAIKRTLMLPDNLGMTNIKYGSRSKAEVEFKGIFYHNIVRVAKKRERVVNYQILNSLLKQTFPRLESYDIFKINTDRSLFTKENAEILQILIDKKIIDVNSFTDDDWKWIRKWTDIQVIKDYLKDRKIEPEKEIKEPETKVSMIKNQNETEPYKRLNKMDSKLDSVVKYQKIDKYLSIIELETRLSIQDTLRKIQKDYEKELLKKKNNKDINKFNLKIDGDRKAEFKKAYKNGFIKTYYKGVEESLREIEAKAKIETRAYFDDIPYRELKALADPELQKWVSDWKKQTGIKLTPDMKAALSRVEEMAFTIAGVLSTTIEDQVKNIIVSNIERTSVENIVKIIQRDVFDPKLFTPSKDGRAPTDWQLRTNVRTNMSTIYNNGRMDMAFSDDIAGVVSAVMYSAIIDSQTTDFCAGHNGDIFEASDPRVAMYTPPAHFNALINGTKIKTDQNEKNIEDIKIGDMVLTHKGNYRKVYDIMSKYEDKEYYEIELENGNIINITGEHPVLTERGWIEVDNLKLSDNLICSKDIKND